MILQVGKVYSNEETYKSLKFEVRMDLFMCDLTWCHSVLFTIDIIGTQTRNKSSVLCFMHDVFV